MATFSDSLRSVLERLGLKGQQGPIDTAFSHQLALAAYMSSGMLRKVIAIPAEDRVREWRDWQAEKDQIDAIEAEERRLGLQAKIEAAEVLRGIGGGALLLITAGSHSSELKPETIQQGGLVAVNLLSRWQIQGVDWIREMAHPDFGKPSMFRISNGSGNQDIHPSRVVPFRGKSVPAGATMTDEDAFWGDSQLLRVFREVQRADQTQEWFSALVRKAKLTRMGIPNLEEMDDATLTKRVEVIAMAENSLNTVLYRSGTPDDPGEEITDYQITWAGIPAVMDAFDQRVAAVADIPFTRLMGRSPAGMNATGDHDTDNYDRMVKSSQTIQLKPCLDQIDAVLLRSAGIETPAGTRNADGKNKGAVTWKFAPLWTPTEADEATTFKTTMEALTALQNTGTIPDIAFSKGVQNLMSEREYIPGLDQALADIPEAERFPEGPTEEEMRAEIEAEALAKGGGQNLPAGGGAAKPPARRAANDAWFFSDARPAPLYVQRKLLNAADLIAWAKSNGFDTTLPADDMHVTVLYSRTAVDPMKMGETWTSEADGGLTVKPGGPRAIEMLGENAIVLLFASWSLVSRHREMVEAGASHDYPEYQPHITISYDVPAGIDLDTIKPFTGELRFGREIFEPLDLDWKSRIEES